MLIGYNNDVQYRGKTFHIQTEDRGAPSLQIETQIFHAGAILDTRIVSYQELHDKHSDRDTRNKSIKSLMQTTHRELYKNLFSGAYDEFVGLEPQKKEESDAVVDFTPSQDRVPDSARELEEKGADSFDIKEAGDHIDLSSLKSRLARMSVVEDDDEDDEEEFDEEMATQVVTGLDQIPGVVQADAKKPGVSVSKPILSFSKGSAGAVSRAKPTPVKLSSSGSKAWQGCAESTEDLSILGLVEAFIKKG